MTTARALSAEAALRASQEAQGKAVEVIAERIYNDWREQFGWVPWVPRGNSVKQNDARQAARQTLAQVEGISTFKKDENK